MTAAVRKLITGRSYEAAKWAEQQRTGSPFNKVVLLVLANAAARKPILDGEGDAFQCHPSQGTIALRAECSPDAVIDSLDELERRGLLIRRLRYDARGKRTSSDIFLNTDGEDLLTIARRVGKDKDWRPKPPKEERKRSRAGKRAVATTSPLTGSQPCSETPSLTSSQPPTNRLPAGDRITEPRSRTRERRNAPLSRRKFLIEITMEPPAHWVEWVHQHPLPKDARASLDSIIAESFKSFAAFYEGRGRKTEPAWLHLWEKWWTGDKFTAKRTERTSTPDDRQISINAYRQFAVDGSWDSRLRAEKPRDAAHALALAAELLQQGSTRKELQVLAWQSEPLNNNANRQQKGVA